MRRVLIVDDEADIREIAEMTLELVGGWEAASVASGREAVEFAATSQPDAILLDVMMPLLDGPATLNQLRSNPATRDIPVIFLTAKVQAKERLRLRELGAAGVLPKPFDPVTLPAQIAATLGWQEAQ